MAKDVYTIWHTFMSTVGVSVHFAATSSGEHSFLCECGEGGTTAGPPSSNPVLRFRSDTCNFCLEPSGQNIQKPVLSVHRGRGDVGGQMECLSSITVSAARPHLLSQCNFQVRTRATVGS